MFGTIMKTWKAHTFETELVLEFLEMINRSAGMFDYARKNLIRNKQGKKAEKRIFFTDQSINNMECNIRRRVLVHLSTNPDVNLTSCLVMISVTKDAERVGDYVKNLFELLPMVKDEDVSDPLFESLFVEIGANLSSLFNTVHDAFKKSDIQQAREAIETGNRIASACQNIIDAAADESSSRRGVMMALGARYMKRIARHLTNISSSIVNPLTEIDFAGSSSKAE